MCRVSGPHLKPILRTVRLDFWAEPIAVQAGRIQDCCESGPLWSLRGSPWMDATATRIANTSVYPVFLFIFPLVFSSLSLQTVALGYAGLVAIIVAAFMLPLHRIVPLVAFTALKLKLCKSFHSCYWNFYIFLNKNNSVEWRILIQD